MFETWTDVAAGALKVKTEPPLKSTLYCSLKTSSATMLIDQDRAGDPVPELLPADEVERDLTAVQPPAEVAEPGHHASFGEVRAEEAGVTPVAGRVLAGREPRHGDFAPSLAGSSPDHR